MESCEGLRERAADSLTCGLQGKPLSPAAVGRVVAFEKSIKEEPAALRALAKLKNHDAILDRVRSNDHAYTTSATLCGVAADLLIRGKEYEKALQALEEGLKRFPSSLRLLQLQGLALRRAGKLDEAAFKLTLLFEKGHRDTETLGILAAVWADLWERREASGDAAGARDALEQSRNLYRQGFNKVPTDTYTGINAASKSALLGDLDEAITLANQVLTRLEEMTKERGGGPSADYWERVTEPEALLLKGDWDRSTELYHDARVAHQNELGSIESTATQLRRLLKVLPVPEDCRQKLVKEFGL